MVLRSAVVVVCLSWTAFAEAPSTQAAPDESDVPDPVERYKLSLAGYTFGPGHVDDAREILTARKLPKDTWRDVMPVMLELAKEKVYGHTSHGYCRCGEPVDYVNHFLERYDGYRQLLPDAAVKNAGAR